MSSVLDKSMRYPTKLILAPLLLLILGISGDSGAAGYRDIDRIKHLTQNDWTPFDLSGSYGGRATVSTADRERYLLKGSTTLVINKKRFTLTDQQKNTLSGDIDARWFKDKNLGAGTVKLDNENSSFEIRWDRQGNILRLFSAAGANRVFRFCSTEIKRRECLADTLLTR
jgi:hypothetical protein